MNGLWADGWFYVSSAGLLVSGVLFFFLLGQYRAAADAADGAQAALEPEAGPAPIRPVYVADEPSASPWVASAPGEPSAERPKIEAAAAAAPDYAGPDRRRENVTGGLSPAVAYLQNIKTQLDGLHGQMAELTKRVESVSSRDEALIERLGELTIAVGGLKSFVAAAPAAEPAQPVGRARAPVVEKAVEPAPAVEPAVMKLELGPAPGARVVKTNIPDATIRLDPDEVAKSLEPAPEEIEAAEAPPPEKTEAAKAAGSEKPARRGPVWPV